MLDLIKCKTFVHQRTLNRGQPTKQEIIFASNVFDTILISHTQCLSLNSKETIQFKNRQKVGRFKMRLNKDQK